MKIFKNNSALLSYINPLRKTSSIGFVPTMGALHSGHCQLIKESQKQSKITICSIFINPTQFNSTDDFAKYPITLAEDLKKLKALNCDIVYTPKTSDLYNQNVSAKAFNFKPLSIYMEGEFRPGHFNGVATVVKKLFEIVMPTKSFFGEKDLQQLQIIKLLVKQLNLPIEIIGVPTVREKSGLAKSSRNKLLSEKEKKDAALIYQCLNYCRFNKNADIKQLKSYIEDQIKKKKTLELEYVEFVSLKTLAPIEKWQNENQSAICISAYINNVRLIDNIIL